MDMREWIMDLANEAGLACAVKGETKQAATFSFTRRSLPGQNISIEAKMFKWHFIAFVDELRIKLKYDAGGEASKKMLQSLIDKFERYIPLSQKALEYGGLEKAFLYGGLHFIPEGPVSAAERLIPESQPECWQKKDDSTEPVYSYDDFVSVAGIPDALFRCVEDGKLYKPCEEALLEYMCPSDRNVATTRRYIYESHMGGLFITNRRMSDDELFCENCGNADFYIGCARTRKEAWNLLKDDIDINGSGGWDREYVMEFLKNWK